MLGDTGRGEMHILIVEDDRRLARQLKKGIDECGHSAGVAFEGREGLEAAQNSEFDVIVLDVMLPGIDGITIVKQLRAPDRHASSPADRS